MFRYMSFVAVLVVPAVAAAQPPDSAEHEPVAIQLSLWESVQIASRERSVHGLRLSIYGRNHDLQGADIGLVMRLDGDLTGAQLGVAGIVDGDVKGLQNNWLLSMAGGRVQGLQWSGVNMAHDYEGAQLGAINYVEESSVGGRLGLVNVALAEVRGADIGGVNYARRVEGVQLGLVNVAEHLHGVQVGLVNVALNGFLPVFVVFNAAL